jgi:hypothetical protein
VHQRRGVFELQVRISWRFEGKPKKSWVESSMDNILDVGSRACSNVDFGVVIDILHTPWAPCHG